MLAVCASAIVVVTRCAWYEFTGHLDAKRSPPGPGFTGNLIQYKLLPRFTRLYRLPRRVVFDF